MIKGLLRRMKKKIVGNSAFASLKKLHNESLIDSPEVRHPMQVYVIGKSGCGRTNLFNRVRSSFDSKTLYIDMVELMRLNQYSPINDIPNQAKVDLNDLPDILIIDDLRCCTEQCLKEIIDQFPTAWKGMVVLGDQGIPEVMASLLTSYSDYDHYLIPMFIDKTDSWSTFQLAPIQVQGVIENSCSDYTNGAAHPLVMR